MTTRSSTRQGLIYGVAAYMIWGLFPLYWALLQPASAPEILAHRIAWSVLVMGFLLVATRRVPQFKAIWADRRTSMILGVAAALVAANWGTYIWGVNNGRVVETALGYFINPLVNVLIGVFLLGERLRRVQWLAVGVAFVAVLILTWDYGHPPWVALVLAFSFGLYGLAKKKAAVEAIESLTFETSLLAPLASGYLLYLWMSAHMSFGAHGSTHAVLLASTGLATAIPLLLFGAAAIRVPLSSLGLLQYLGPVMQFLIGLVAFHEPMSHLRWIGFTVLWAALAIFTLEALNHHRRTLTAVVV